MAHEKVQLTTAINNKLYDLEAMKAGTALPAPAAALVMFSQDPSLPLRVEIKEIGNLPEARRKVIETFYEETVKPASATKATDPISRAQGIPVHNVVFSKGVTMPEPTSKPSGEKPSEHQESHGPKSRL